MDQKLKWDQPLESEKGTRVCYLMGKTKGNGNVEWLHTVSTAESQVGGWAATKKFIAIQASQASNQIADLDALATRGSHGEKGCKICSRSNYMKEGRVKNDSHHCEKGGSVFRSNREGEMDDERFTGQVPQRRH